jgi:hypothetical protein
MDFVRITGEWFIYYVLITLAAVHWLIALIREPAGLDADTIAERVLHSGAAGAVNVAAWLVRVEAAVVENIAPR